MKRFLCMLLAFLMICPALAETVQDQALLFIQDAGIEADSVLRVDNEIIITLMNRGTASLYTYGDFDMYDLSWRFDGAADSDVALYLDHALGILAALEARIPTADEMRARDYGVMVSNSLLYLEHTGEQGLRILLAQLSLHDDSGLNSLRARLASRLLGFTDATPVDPAEGLAWYDALTISVQDELPPVDASVYVEDPFLAQVTQLMIAREEERRADYTWGDDVDPAKTTTVVTLHASTVRLNGDAATVFAYVWSQKYALYDGVRLRRLSGSGTPSRIELEKTEDEWGIVSVTESEDGTEYWPSILAFCDGDEKLAESLTSGGNVDAHDAAVRAYLAANGYTAGE